ncbi:vitamin B12-dependent ribonucleotide reductase [Megalodesulfovibrio gigas]|uniref:Vitamin B12-dependent ribonucleotide reductase n=1 Tax=Megalodesulfovibrio gigas (strain ATCC 19364 / DSM 1382 / NCIMB 9332 / VKM B-1759) TaxID=1121448 RepID=T2G9E0_MEGG1|nr:vitamin B12-dependent ribonucleotide reductase [Megalodesulfovibrio gigas]AGW12736.1 putative ribonucleotide-diphosphate reductase [Megalodesulfovibrio gigas DSM 1382 = ATCC 19364]
MTTPSAVLSAMPSSLPAPQLSPNAETVLAKRYLRKNLQGEITETPQELFWRVATAVAEAERAYPDSPWSAETLAEAFYLMMSRFDFLPNSPTLMNAGACLGQLAACFVLPVADSIDDIFDAVKHAALIHKSGGGTGFSFSRLRPKNSRVGSTGGVASGPLSFLRIFNTATEQIKQGGTRRGANMGILRVDHPDILEFIAAKEKEGELNNFNLSVALTEAFMQAVEKDAEYSLVEPHTGQEVQRLKAKDVFELLVTKAWASGDPGIIFLDRINRDNPTPDQGEIESTNPCGEQPLLPYEACNLGSLNLSQFHLPGDVSPSGVHGSIDWDRLKETVQLAVRFLDNVIDVSRYPLEQITDTVRRNRKIGLGVMGFADLLFQLRIPYNSAEALDLGERIMECIQDESKAASALLAAERGPFPAYATSAFAARKEGPYRNATTTTIAPTGTLSILAACSSGIEPLFALAFTRHVLDGAKLMESNPFFEDALRESGHHSPALMEDVATKGTVHHMRHLPDWIRRVFVTSHDISGEYHLKMQAAFQRFTDNAVSKTVNLPNAASKDDVRQIYTMAYTLGCKGVTVYRDGCKQVQVLCTGEQGQAQPADGKPSKVKQRPEVIYGFTHKINTGLGILYLTVNEIDGRPFEVFATIGKSGRSITAKAEAIGRLVSLALRSGVEPAAIVGQLKGIGGEHPVFRKKGMIQSIPDAVAWVFETHYMGGTDTSAPAEKNGLASPVCPDCGGDLIYQEGCFCCQGCAYTKCG